MEGTIAPEQIIINGTEYTPEDATRFIELGKKYNEMEGKLNTSLDKVFPEYTKATQRNKELEEQLAEEKRQREALQNKSEVSPDLQEVRKRAREAGIADVDYLKEKGYMTREEAEEFFTSKTSQQKLVDSILTRAQSLEKEIDGSDGRVPFDSDAVLAYASAYNIDNLEEAYDRMNSKGNARWKEAQLAKEEKPGLTTLRGGGKKEPVASKITDDNFKQAWDELYGTE